MPVTIPPLSSEQQQELDAICENEQLMEFMEAGLPNQGKVESEDTILERQRQAVEAFSKNSKDFWSFN